MDPINPVKSINSDFEFSLYPNLFTVTEPVDKIDVNQLFEIIKYGYIKDVIVRLRNASSKKQYSSLKRSEIPCVTLSGIFKHRSLKGFINHSGLVQIDLDNVDDIIKVFTELCEDEYTYLCFLSPGGKGLKAVVKITGTFKLSSLKT